MKRNDLFLIQYREQIRSGEIKAGQEMIVELDNLISDLDDEQYNYDTTFAYQLMDFIENCCKLTKSPFYAQPMKLLLWEKAMIEVAFSFKIKSIDTDDWIDRFQEILLLIARKNGKTELIAAILLGMMILGRSGSDIVCSGTNDGVADICFQAINTMRLLIDPDQIDTWINQKGIKCFANNNKIFKLSDSTRSKEGRNIDVAGIDELHELLTDSIYKPIQQSTSTKPDYKIFMFSSEGFTNDGFLDLKLKEYRKIIFKEDVSESSKRKLPWLYTMDSEQEVWDTNDYGFNNAWEKANPSIRVIKTLSYLRDRVDEGRQSKTDRMFVLSKDFNFKVTNGQAWLMREDFDYEAPFDIEDFRGYWYLGAVDLAETTDLVNAKAIIIKKGSREKFILSHYWIPESKMQESDDKQAGAKYLEWASQGMLTICEGNDVDLSLVADWFQELRTRYGLELYRLGYDQKFKRDFVNKMAFYGWIDGKDLVMIQQSPEILHTPNRQVEADLRDKLIVGLNELDKWCLGNAALKINSQGKSLVVKIDGAKAKRIDGAVCLVIAQETLNRYKSELLDYLID